MADNKLLSKLLADIFRQDGKYHLQLIFGLEGNGPNNLLLGEKFDALYAAVKDGFPETPEQQDIQEVHTSINVGGKEIPARAIGFMSGNKDALKAVLKLLSDKGYSFDKPLPALKQQIDQLSLEPGQKL
jgi:hypothetical protein